MKKILMVIAAVAVLQTVAYAQSIDFSGDVTGGKSVEVTNLENGYYDLTAGCKNASEEGGSYLYGGSDTLRQVRFYLFRLTVLRLP